MLIHIEKVDDDTFKVIVGEADEHTKHTVHVSDEDFKKLTQGKITKEELVKESFEFLLKRESKESILKEFDIMLISKYFPEYEVEVKKLITN